MANFLDLPRELRDQVYRLCLVHPEPLDPQTIDGYGHFGPTSGLALGLLLVSKAVSKEAREVLYSQNVIDFDSSLLYAIDIWLPTIGINTLSITTIRIGFPGRHAVLATEDLEDYAVDPEVLDIIDHSCPNVRSFIISANTSKPAVKCLEDQDLRGYAIKSLDDIYEKFKSMTSLPAITVELYQGRGSGFTRNLLESYGWTIIDVERNDDSFSSLGSLSEDESSDEDDDYSYEWSEHYQDDDEFEEGPDYLVSDDDDDSSSEF